MIRRSWLLLAVVLAAPLAFAQTISNLQPSSATAGSGPLTLTINGQFFQALPPTVYWLVPATDQVTMLNVVSGPSVTQIMATIPASLLTQPGTAQVYVTQGSGTSNFVNFTITQPTTVPPFLSSLSPNSAPAGSPGVTLNVYGSNFPAGSGVTWNGSPLPTSYVNSGQLTAAVPASLLASAGTATVNITAQPQPSPLTFTITPATLALSSISPNSIVAGSPGFTLTANGSGFTNTTVVTWNGSSLSTSFVSSAQLTAAVPASLIATAGTASVGVVASGQASPAPLTFTITPNVTITSISPTSALAGAPAFNLTVNGTGFNSGTVVYWNSVALSGMAVNSGQIIAPVPANLIAQPGTASITAQNGSLVSNAVTFTITSPALALSSISPNSAIAGGPAFTLTANGSGIVNGAVLTWNGSPLSTAFVSATQLTAAIPANLIATSGTASVGVSESGQSSPAPLSFVITPALTITSVSPSSVPAGSPSAFILTVNGAGFAAGTNVLWNGLVLSTTVVNVNLMTASVPANLVAQIGSATITAQNGSVVSNAVTFSITGAQAGVTLSSLSPNSAPVGNPAFTLTVNGSGFIAGFSSGVSVAGSVVTWNGSPLTTTYVSTTQLTAVVPATLLTTAGTAAVSVTGQPQPASLPFTISNAQTLTLSSISPSTVSAGGPSFTLTVNGTGFSSTTTVTWNGSQLTTTFVSPTQLVATVPAILIVYSGTVAIDVSVPAGQTPPPDLQLTITQGLTLTSLTPSSTAAGGTAFTLTVNGSGFSSGSAVLWNGSTSLTTTFVSTTQLTAAVSATLIAQPGSASVTVSSGNLVSNALTFTITAPGPVITSISPATVAAGGPALTLTVSGTGFVSGAVVSLNNMPLTTTFVSATQVTAAVPAALTAQPGPAKITLINPSGLTSNAVALTITAPTPVITSISPSTVAVGGPAFTLTVNGTGFASGGSVSLNGTPLTTTFVSATQVTAGVPTTYTAQPGTAQITFANPSGPASNAVTLTITAPVPVITSISPSSVASGGPAFLLTVTGTGFLTGATVSFNSTTLVTTVVSATQLTAAVPANVITQPGTASITASNTGTAGSNAVSLTITPPTPTITGISPTSVNAGGPAFLLTVNGSGFLTGASVFVNGTSVTTTVVSATQLTAQVPANLIAQPATLQITAGNQGGSQSVAATLTVNPAPPSLTSISPASANVGDPAFTLTLTGAGFVQASIVQWNGAPLGTTFVSATQLTATVDAGRLILPGTASVTVVNQVPAGAPLVSNALTFTINAVLPVVSSISPNSITAGSPAFSLTVNGSGFLTLTTVQWNTTTLTTHFSSATQVTADVPATLLAQAGTVTVTAVNPGNNVSAAFTFTINPSSPPVITSLSQTSATAGGAAFSLTVTGTGFISGAVVSFGSTALATTFVSATQLTAAVPANLLLTQTTYQVVVQQAGSSSNALSFAVNLPPPPSLTLNPPAISLPAQQPTIGFALNTSYPLALSGTVTLTFASNATVPVDDPSIQFATGGRTFTFSVPPNTTTLPALLIQTGTVAGVITLNVALTAAGVDITPTTGSSATITIQKVAPVIRTVTLIHANGYLEADINGFSTTRDMTTAVFTLNPAPGGSFTSSVITVPVTTLFTGWYQSSAATAFGSQFTYAQPFTVIGDTNQILSVTVTLTNSSGTSVATMSK